MAPGGQPYGGPPRRSGSGWLIAILVIFGGFVMFGGVLAVLAIYGVRKYVANAKIAEARSSLGQIGRDAAAAYERESSPGPLHRLCPSASRSVPDSVVMVSGKKYASSAAEWQVDAGRHAGFACLRFSLATPQYYMYSYKARGTGAPGDQFDATAIGDLNGDGQTSFFRISGQVSPSGVVTVSPNLVEQNPEE
jgi:hypothetical protein